MGESNKHYSLCLQHKFGLKLEEPVLLWGYTWYQSPNFTVRTLGSLYVTPNFVFFDTDIKNLVVAKYSGGFFIDETSARTLIEIPIWEIQSVVRTVSWGLSERAIEINICGTTCRFVCVYHRTAKWLESMIQYLRQHSVLYVEVIPLSHEEKRRKDEIYKSINDLVADAESSGQLQCMPDMRTLNSCFGIVAQINASFQELMDCLQEHSEIIGRMIENLRNVEQHLEESRQIIRNFNKKQQKWLRIASLDSLRASVEERQRKLLCVYGAPMLIPILICWKTCYQNAYLCFVRDFFCFVQPCNSSDLTYQGVSYEVIPDIPCRFLYGDIQGIEVTDIAQTINIQIRKHKQIQIFSGYVQHIVNEFVLRDDGVTDVRFDPLAKQFQFGDVEIKKVPITPRTGMSLPLRVQPYVPPQPQANEPPNYVRDVMMEMYMTSAEKLKDLIFRLCQEQVIVGKVLDEQTKALGKCGSVSQSVTKFRKQTVQLHEIGGIDS